MFEELCKELSLERAPGSGDFRGAYRGIPILFPFYEGQESRVCEGLKKIQEVLDLPGSSVVEGVLVEGNFRDVYYVVRGEYLSAYKVRWISQKEERNRKVIALLNNLGFIGIPGDHTVSIRGRFKEVDRMAVHDYLEDHGVQVRVYLNRKSIEINFLYTK